MSSKKLLIFGLIPALLFQLIGAELYFDVWATEPLGKVIFLLTKVLLLVWPLLWWKSIKTPFQLRPNKLKSELSSGFTTGFFLSLALVAAFSVFPNKELLASQIALKAEAYLNLNLELYLLFSLFLVFFHSLLEEYYWRWFCVKGLSQNLKTLPSLLIANAAFAAHHFVVLMAFVDLAWGVLGTFGVFLGGLTWSFLYKKTNSLFAPWISHACVDATIMGIGYFLLF